MICIPADILTNLIIPDKRFIQIDKQVLNFRTCIHCIWDIFRNYHNMFIYSKNAFQMQCISNVILKDKSKLYQIL